MTSEKDIKACPVCGAGLLSYRHATCGSEACKKTYRLQRSRREDQRRGRGLTDKPVSTDDVQCLVCGRWGQWLGTHIRRVHGLSKRQYRERYDLPADGALTSRKIRNSISDGVRTAIADGRITYDHLPRALEAARAAPRRVSGAGRDARSAATTFARPGDHSQLPIGARRADGRDAAVARIAQQRRRAIRRAQKIADAHEDGINQIRTLKNDLDD